MGEACPFALDASNAATMHWLGLAAIAAFLGVLALITMLISGRMKIEELEQELLLLRSACRREEAETSVSTVAPGRPRA
jgi:hypothetical protein